MSSAPGWLVGVRFGAASAVISAVVILLSLRPIVRFHFTIVAALLTIALVDSLADAYALVNAAHDRGDVSHSSSSAVASILAKLFICGSLALLVYLHAKRSRFAPAGFIYGLAAAFVVGQIALTVAAAAEEDGDGEKRSMLRQVGTLAGLFVVAVVLSLLLRRLLAAVDRVGGRRRMS